MCELQGQSTRSTHSMTFNRHDQRIRYYYRQLQCRKSVEAFGNHDVIRAFWWTTSSKSTMKIPTRRNPRILRINNSVSGKILNECWLYICVHSGSYMPNIVVRLLCQYLLSYWLTYLLTARFVAGACTRGIKANPIWQDKCKINYSYSNWNFILVSTRKI